jgi:tetratricopeptide (TPR) repeat protein
VRDRSRSLKLLFCQVPSLRAYRERAQRFSPLGFARALARFARVLLAGGGAPFDWLVLLGCLTLAVSVVRADDLTDFDHARALYVKRNYAGAATALKVLVGTDPPRVTERLLILESRKYLAASLLFLGQRDEARTQFRLLLAMEPFYALDPLAFPTEVLALFEKVKGDLEVQLAEARIEQERQRAELQRLAQERAEQERKSLERLFTLAQESQVVERNSRWIATIPFGVGQFQNGHKSFGMALAVLQGLAAAGSIATFIGHERVADDRPDRTQVDDKEAEETRWRTANQATFGVFAALAVIGIIDAHARFVPGRTSSRKRPLPPDLKRWGEERKIAIDGNGLRLTF